jgi:hypothetical protein
MRKNFNTNFVELNKLHELSNWAKINNVLFSVVKKNI